MAVVEEDGRIGQGVAVVEVVGGKTSGASHCPTFVRSRMELTGLSTCCSTVLCYKCSQMGHFANKFVPAFDCTSSPRQKLTYPVLRSCPNPATPGQRGGQERTGGGGGGQRY